MKYLKSKIVAIAAIAAITGLGTGYALAGQPDMQGALASLRNAQAYLDRVTQNKAGHANRARHLVAAAIAQVREGIAVGHSHGE